MGKNDKLQNFIIMQLSVVALDQLSYFESFENSPEGRNQALRSIFANIQDNRKITLNPNITEFTLIFKRKINEELLYLQLARKEDVDMYELKETNITRKVLESYPFIDLIVNLSTQKIAAELKSSVISKKQIGTVLSKIFGQLTLTRQFSIYVNPIIKENNFWEIVRDKEIKQVSFNLIAPNYHDNSNKAKDFVEENKRYVNSDEVEVVFKNKHNKLKIDMAYLKDYVKYSSKAGSWAVKICKNKKVTNIKSDSCETRISVEKVAIDTLKNYAESELKSLDFYIMIEKINKLFIEE